MLPFATTVGYPHGLLGRLPYGAAENANARSGAGRAARALLDGLDDDGEDRDAEQAQVIELIRRMKALDAGQANVIDAAEARARVLARLRSVRGQ